METLGIITIRVVRTIGKIIELVGILTVVTTIPFYKPKSDRKP